MAHSTLEFQEAKSSHRPRQGFEIHSEGGDWVGTIFWDRQWVVETYDDWLWSKPEMLDIIAKIDELESSND